MKKTLERLPELLRRFRRLSRSTSIFATEHRVETFSSTHPGTLRDMLLGELGFLREQHERFSKTGKQTLKELEAILREAKDADLREVLPECYRTLQVMRRSLFRAELAGWDTRELMDEWNEWKRAESFADGDEGEALIRQERKELLRSELALRGVSLNKKEPFQSESVPMLVEPTPIVRDEYEAAGPRTLPNGEDLFEAWEQDYGDMIDQELAYWTEAKRCLEQQGLEGAQALPFLKAYKRTHGEKKHFKRHFDRDAFSVLDGRDR